MTLYAGHGVTNTVLDYVSYNPWFSEAYSHAASKDTKAFMK